MSSITWRSQVEAATTEGEANNVGGWRHGRVVSLCSECLITIQSIRGRERCEAEVQDFYQAIVGHHDVRWLQIAVDDADRMGFRQHAGRLNRVGQRVFEAEGSYVGLANTNTF